MLAFKLFYFLKKIHPVQFYEINLLDDVGKVYAKQ